MTPSPHEAYLDASDPDVRTRLVQIQSEVQRRVPDAERCMGYQMPAFRKGRIFFYFGAFKSHIGVYPPIDGPPDLIGRLAPWRGPKGNLSFRHKDDLPLALIGEVAERLAEKYGR